MWHVLDELELITLSSQAIDTKLLYLKVEN